MRTSYFQKLTPVTYFRLMKSGQAKLHVQQSFMHVLTAPQEFREKGAVDISVSISVLVAPGNIRFHFHRLLK